MFLFMASCNKGPQLGWMLWSNERAQFEGVDATGKPLICKPPDKACESLIAVTPHDFDVLVTYMNNKCN